LFSRKPAITGTDSGLGKSKSIPLQKSRKGLSKNMSSDDLKKKVLRAPTGGFKTDV